MRDEPRKPTLLLVDDQPINIRALANLLKADYRIVVATGGEKALEIAAREPQPDLILLDVQMPVMDGYEVCRRLRSAERTSRIPIIFVTALSASEDEERGLNLGAMDYISKPFHPSVVRARVRNQVNLKAKADLLEQLSMVDGLTAIANRRYFDIYFDEEWKRARREDKPLSVLMMDMDHFKSYNDRYGHGVGDECLAQVAGTLAHNLVRPTDRVARYGGEEFVALLPQTDLEGAMVVAEKLRKAVEALGRPHERSAAAPVVTISVGVAAIEEGDEASPATLLKRADDALYLAKEGGRNRCCSKASRAGAAAALPRDLRGVCSGLVEGYNETLQRDDGISSEERSTAPAPDLS